MVGLANISTMDTDRVDVESRTQQHRTRQHLQHWPLTVSIEDIAHRLEHVLTTLPLCHLNDAADLTGEATTTLEPIATESNDPDIAQIYGLWQQALHDIHHAQTICTKIRNQINEYRSGKLGASDSSCDVDNKSEPARGRQLSKSAQRAIVSFEKQIAAHEEKLAKYKANPYAYDNTRRLANEPDPAVRDEIFRGRIRRLEKEMQRFYANIKKVYDEGL